jgi:tetratricopeptide (TPR) repeat protein
MVLSGSQKKYIGKHIRRSSLSAISKKTGVPENEILDFLKNHWGKEKYQKFVTGLKTPELSSLKNGSLKTWLTKNWKVLVFFAALVSIVYANSLGNDFISDDIGAIRDNPQLNKFIYFWHPPYFRLSLVSFIIFLTNKVFGLVPVFYRLPNILFHLGSVILIFFLLAHFFPSPIPFFTASLFAVHPILVESVSWISGTPYSGSAFFILLSFLTYILSTKKKAKFLLLSFVFFYIALLFSEKVIFFPLVLFLYEVCFGRLKTNWKKLIPFFVLGGFWILYLAGLVGTRITALATKYYQQPERANPLVQIPIAITSYLGLIFWPQKLTLYHTEMAFGRVEFIFRAVCTVLSFVLLGFFFKKDRRIFFWGSFFVIALSPTLLPLGISWIVAERYVYLGAIGILAIFSLLVYKLGEKVKNPKVAYTALVVTIVLLSVRTIVRNADWKNQDTLWGATAKFSPSSPQNHNNLGDMYARHGDLQKAAEEFKTAIQLKPNYGDAFHNLANVYQQMGKDDLAIENYQKALSFNPNLWQSYQNLAAIYFDQGKFLLAKENLEKAIGVNSQNSYLYSNLGIIYLNLGEREKAKEATLRALELDPQNQKAKQFLIEID